MADSSVNSVPSVPIEDLEMAESGGFMSDGVSPSSWLR